MMKALSQYLTNNKIVFLFLLSANSLILGFEYLYLFDDYVDTHEQF